MSTLFVHRAFRYLDEVRGEELTRLAKYRVVYFDNFKEIETQLDDECCFLLDDFEGELYKTLMAFRPPPSMLGPTIFHEKMQDKENEFNFYRQKVLMFF